MPRVFSIPFMRDARIYPDWSGSFLVESQSSFFVIFDASKQTLIHKQTNHHNLIKNQQKMTKIHIGTWISKHSFSLFESQDKNVISYFEVYGTLSFIIVSAYQMDLSSG